MALTLEDSLGQVWQIAVNTDGTLQVTQVAGFPVDTTYPSGHYKGLTRAQVIEMADKRTERRAGDRLDLNLEYINALQEFCESGFYFWRKKTFTFTTEADTPTYDITSTLLGSATDVGQFSKIVVVNGCELTPIWKPEDQARCLDDTLTGAPKGYFPDPGNPDVLRLWPIPNGAYPVRVIYYSTPNLNLDDNEDQIPLVPHDLRKAIAVGMEKNIWAFLNTEGNFNAQLASAQKRYDDLVEDALTSSKDFAVGIKKEWRDHETQAIRGTM